jgi:kynurenine formamidase
MEIRPRRERFEMKVKRVYDLSMGIKDDMRVFPGMSGPSITRMKTHDRQGIQVTGINMIVHSGTHVDAPLHMMQEGDGINDVPLETLIGEALVVDLTFKPPGSEILLEDFERDGGDIKRDDIVILHTGYEDCDDASKYCPLSPAAAKWLAGREIKCLGVDTPSLDPINTASAKASARTHPSHHIILKAGIPIVECLANLGTLKSNRIFFCCLCLKIDRSDGAPARAVALDLE